MNKSILCLGAVLAVSRFIGPAGACEGQPHAAELCAVAPLSADVRDAPNGRVAYGASGKVRVAGRSGDGLWTQIEVPCIGYKGWISSQDLTCEGKSARAELPAKP